jgi:predicted TIM-barrel fold metal-dependent hydrolase
MLLPDPEPRTKHFSVISVDDHLCEPPHMFEGRMPSKFVEAAPRILESDNGTQAWAYEGQLYPNVGLNAVVGRPREEWNWEPTRFDEMRKGAFDPHARVADMNIAGIDASLCFPSLLAGFAGTKFARSNDQELGLACVRAWNDWHIEEWTGSYPDRLIPLQISWLGDPEVGAAEIRRNAERGFRAVSFPESVANVGYPSVHTEHWDPFFRACEETGTVLCLHTGTGEWHATFSPEAPIQQATSLFPVCGLAAAADFLWARIPLRFPELRIALSEGGIGWVPMFLDRLEYMEKYEMGSVGADWDVDIKPSEALQRNFYFCTIDDPSTIGLRQRIGIEHIMVEVDYPHASSTWPDTQTFLSRTLSGLSDDEVQKITWKNASHLFRHQLN